MLNGRFNKELYYEYRRWLPYISDIFLTIIDTEKGDFRFLPFPGSLMEQPYMTMSVLKVIQGVYREEMSKKMDKIKAGSGSSRRRR